MSTKTLLAIDQGTTSSRAILFSEKGEVLVVKQKELALHYPHKGWVEQDANDIWNDTLWACQEVLKEGGMPLAVGITNQRETTIVWDRITGDPIYNAIVWQDRRTADRCAELKKGGHEDKVSAKTGLLLDPYFSATKVAWILDHVDGARARAKAGELAFGTVDSWLMWKLTNGKVHVTDVTNASRTMLFDITKNEWDTGLCELFDVPENMLPEVKDNVAAFGVSELFDEPLKIGGVAGDQQAALIGQACFEKGMVKSTYGTGCFALMNIGEEFKLSENRLLTTIGYRLNGKTTYALEGSIFIAGAAIQWLRDGLQLFDNAAESEKLAMSVSGNNGVYFVPAFTGLGAPYWEPDAKGLICGLSRESTKEHIARAALEAQAYQTCDLMDAFEGDSGIKTASIRADGGLVANDFMVRFLAGILDCNVEIPKVHESTAWGAAALAGLHCGIFKSLDDISATWQLQKRFAPEMKAQEREALYSGWKDAVKRTRT